jgi:uncharacterized protein YprB with RNaseH-like and TPR domain
MDLRERLRALNGGKPLAAPMPMRRQAGIETVLPGDEVATPHGATFVVERRFPLDHRHGASIGHLAGVAPGRLAELTGDARLTALDPAGAVVLDTETTGLAGGTGTYTFLVGLGLVERGEFVVRQFFLRGLGEERAMLAHLAEHLRRRGGLITYNGRAFDWPLLTTRFTLARQRAALPELPHWDVLPMARRLWRSRLGGCGLSALEAQVLGQARHDDTPGWLIPQLYFDYLRDGDARRLRGVFEHNQRDILALAALAGLICRALADPFDGAVADGQDFAALARHAEACGQEGRALALYRHALTLPLPPAEREAAQRSLGLLLKRARRWEEAAQLWTAMLAQPLADPLFPALELAKHHEHVQRDYRRAIALVERLLLARELRSAPHERAALEHRLARLKRRDALWGTNCATEAQRAQRER